MRGTRVEEIIQYIQTHITCRSIGSREVRAFWLTGLINYFTVDGPPGASYQEVKHNITAINSTHIVPRVSMA